MLHNMEMRKTNKEENLHAVKNFGKYLLKGIWGWNPNNVDFKYVWPNKASK